jgi:hypothetical protein
MRINNDRDLTLGDLPMQERAVEMSEDRSEKVSDKDKIQILLQEYNTLRSELVSNGSKQFQLVALAGVLVSLILGRPIEKGLWVATLVGVGALFCLGVMVIRHTRRLVRRVIELETEINRRAGEELLVWESRWGAVVTGFVLRRPPLPPKSAPPQAMEEKPNPQIQTTR